MNRSRVFNVTQDGATLVVALPATAVTFADEEIQAELEGILERVKVPTIGHVVLDFNACPYFGSAVLIALFALKDQVKEKQGRFAMCNASQIGREILQTAKLDTTFPYFESQAEALAAVLEA